MGQNRPVRDVRREVDVPEPVDPLLPFREAEPVFIAEELLVSGKADEHPEVGPPGSLQIGKEAARHQRRNLCPAEAISELSRRYMGGPHWNPDMHRGD